MQTIIMLFTIVSCIFGASIYLDGLGDRIDSLEHKLESSMLTDEHIKEVATIAAQEVIYDYKKDIAIVDADDFVKGWVEQSNNMEMCDYVEHCFTNKTRVYKGGRLMIENEFGTRRVMEEKYGPVIVADLIDCLLRFK